MMGMEQRDSYRQHRSNVAIYVYKHLDGMQIIIIKQYLHLQLFPPT
jgi:hypothetical protein